MSRMKWKHLASTLVLLASWGGFALAEELCTPDCPESQWGPVESFEIELPGGCRVLVSYTTRHACGTYWDLELVDILPINFEHASCAAYTVMEARDFLDVVTEQLLSLNPMGFPPSTPIMAPPSATGVHQLPTSLPNLLSCEDNWRVVNGCWTKLLHFNNPAGDVANWAPCCSDACCVTRYEVCVDSCGNRTVDEMYTTGGPVSCPDNSWYPCVSVCD